MTVMFFFEYVKEIVISFEFMIKWLNTVELIERTQRTHGILY